MNAAETVYLDHNASTPILPAAFEAMLPFLREGYANPSAIHVAGENLRRVLEEAREVIAGLLGYRFATRTLPGAVEHGGRVLGGAVVFYAAVISAMVVTAWATGIVLAAVGAMLFAVSDWVLGHRRFVGPLPGGRLAIMVPYHVGQALLIVGLTTG